MLKTTKALMTATALTAASATLAIADFALKDPSVIDADSNIVENAMVVSNLGTLVTAVQSAGLAPDLMGEGPFTVFAPVNSAFRDLDTDMVDKLMMPENRADLVNLLQTHVVPAEITSTTIANFLGDREILENITPGIYEVRETAEGTVLELTTIGNTKIEITSNGGDYYIDFGATDSAEILVADLESSNGVVHLIDTVLVR